MRSMFLTAPVLLVATLLIGCSNGVAPTVAPAETVTSAKPDWQLVTLHIDGFKKSKSGGT